MAPSICSNSRGRRMRPRKVRYVILFLRGNQHPKLSGWFLGQSSWISRNCAGPPLSPGTGFFAFRPTPTHTRASLSRASNYPPGRLRQQPAAPSLRSSKLCPALLDAYRSGSARLTCSRTRHAGAVPGPARCCRPFATHGGHAVEAAQSRVTVR